jgi:hypothetical protein
MFLDRLRDIGIEVYGDKSKVNDAVQEIADAVVSLMPRMGSQMLVSINNSTLQLFWQMRDRTMQVAIDNTRRVSVKVDDGTIHRTHYCAGESSALGACLQKGLDVYQNKSKASL